MVWHRKTFLRLSTKCGALTHGFPKCSVRSPRASQEKLKGSANKRLFIRFAEPFSQWQYKFTAQCFQCVQSYFDPMKLILKSIEFRERERRCLFFEDHPNFGQYSPLSGVVYIGFSSFFSPTLKYLNICKYQIEHGS